MRIACSEVVDLGVISGLTGVGVMQDSTHVFVMQPSNAQVTQLNSAEKREGSGLCPWRPPE